VDERPTCKRPLSVSSTSSSMSSTSSLPRHERKKLATSSVQSTSLLPGLDDVLPDNCSCSCKDADDTTATAGCLSTLAENVPTVTAAAERCRLPDDAQLSPVLGSNRLHLKCNKVKQLVAVEKYKQHFRPCGGVLRIKRIRFFHSVILLLLLKRKRKRSTLQILTSNMKM